MDVTVKKAKKLSGSVKIPPDKSITHRAFMFSALTKGKSIITDFSKGADCMSTLGIIRNLGCKTEYLSENQIFIDASDALKASLTPLDCGNSGTTARLMSGILAGQGFDSKLFGDESLSKRPMKRVTEPLTLAGAHIVHENCRLPYEIKAADLHGINYISPLASAQVKSCLLAAGLFADGVMTFTEPYKSRNHTELMFEYMGADISVNGNSVSVKKSRLNPVDITVCGDISSAAFFLVAAAIVPGSDVTVTGVGINETRSGIIDVLIKMNADIEIMNERLVSNEKVADIRVKYSDLKGTTVEGSIIPRLIDEIPVICVAASVAEGTTVIKNAGDLRNKEADRITAVTNELKKIGADIEETRDGFIINGKKSLKGGCEVECYHDHRIAMSAYVAGLVSENPVTVKEFQWVDISFPEFLELAGKIQN